MTVLRQYIAVYRLRRNTAIYGDKYGRLLSSYTVTEIYDRNTVTCNTEKYGCIRRNTERIWNLYSSTWERAWMPWCRWSEEVPKTSNEKEVFDEKETNRKSDEISQISDQQHKYTIKNCVRYRFILFFVNLFFRLFVPVDQVNRLIDRIFNICEEIVDDHSTCLLYLKKFREHINGYYNENYENEIIQG